MNPAPRQHTPGPWDLEPKGSRHFVDGRRLAKLEAINADLLAALYSIATEPSAIYSGANAHIGDIARAAIARATGA